MQKGRSQVTLAVVSLLLVIATVFVQGQLARDNDRTDTGQTTQSPANGDTSNALQPALNDPDGLEFERTFIVDSPLSATMILETGTRLTDGTISTNTTTALIYRDSKGRTRRDWLGDPLSAVKVEPARSVINDPVAGFTYDLDHSATSAQRREFVQLRGRNSAAREAARKQDSGRNQILPMPSSFGTGTSLRTGTPGAAAPPVPDSLGTRKIDGIITEGTRLNVTFPTGTVGNDRPVEITIERWYAPSLQAVILVKRTDSRTAETTYKLTDISRSEPAAALFAVPANYKIRDKDGKEVSNK